MKKTTLLSLGILGLLSSSLSFGQTTEKPITWCGSSAKQIELNNTPGYLESVEQDNIAAQHAAQTTEAIPKGQVFYIPIVFHILHEGGVENISDDQIFNQVDIMNEDFRLLNPDAYPS